MPERNIDTAFWQDPKVLQLQPVSRCLLAYLITCPSSHALGIFAVPLYQIEREFGFPREAILDSLIELSEAERAHYDLEREIVWVVNMAKRQARSSVCWRGTEKHLKSLYESPLIAAFVERYEDTEFALKTGPFRPVKKALATLAEPLPKGCRTLAEGLLKGCRRVAEPFGKGSNPKPNDSAQVVNPCRTLAEPFGNPSGTGTGSLRGALEVENERESFTERPREAPPGSRSGQSEAEIQTSDLARCQDLWALQIAARQRCRGKGIRGTGSRALGVTPGMGQFRGTGLLAAVREFPQDQLEHALLVAEAEAVESKSLKYFNGTTNWRPEAIVRAQSEDPKPVAALSLMHQLAEANAEDEERDRAAWLERMAERDTKPDTEPQDRA